MAHKENIEKHINTQKYIDCAHVLCLCVCVELLPFVVFTHFSVWEKNYEFLMCVESLVLSLSLWQS